jgi:hypothetical protein
LIFSLFSRLNSQCVLLSNPRFSCTSSWKKIKTRLRHNPFYVVWLLLLVFFFLFCRE